MGASADGTIRAWTIQPWALWERVAAGEALTVDWRYAAGLHHAYDWLRERLVARVAGWGGHYPWWAYGYKPDLRAHRHLEPRGHTYARIELSLPADRAVVLPHWAWDLVFGGRYVDPDRRVSNAWERRYRRAVPDEDVWPPPEPWRSELYASWERVFDPALPVRGWTIWSRRVVRSTEVVFEVLERSVVRRVSRFEGTRVGRGPRTVLDWHEYLDGPTALHRK
jgi:hypothetical protein